MMNVHMTIEALVHEYRTETNKKPAGLVLGPAEYVQLCEYVKRTQPHLKDAAVNEVYITQYGEYPVFVKEMPGIDLLISYTETYRYLK